MEAALLGVELVAEALRGLPLSLQKRVLEWGAELANAALATGGAERVFRKLERATEAASPPEEGREDPPAAEAAPANGAAALTDAHRRTLSALEACGRVVSSTAVAGKSGLATKQTRQLLGQLARSGFVLQHDTDLWGLFAPDGQTPKVTNRLGRPAKNGTAVDETVAFVEKTGRTKARDVGARFGLSLTAAYRRLEKATETGRIREVPEAGRSRAWEPVEAAGGA